VLAPTGGHLLPPVRVPVHPRRAEPLPPPLAQPLVLARQRSTRSHHPHHLLPAGRLRQQTLPGRALPQVPGAPAPAHTLLPPPPPLALPRALLLPMVTFSPRVAVQGLPVPGGHLPGVCRVAVWLGPRGCRSWVSVRGLRGVLAPRARLPLGGARRALVTPWGADPGGHLPGVVPPVLVRVVVAPLVSPPGVRPFAGVCLGAVSSPVRRMGGVCAARVFALVRALRRFAPVRGLVPLARPGFVHVAWLGSVVSPQAPPLLPSPTPWPGIPFVPRAHLLQIG